MKSEMTRLNFLSRSAAVTGLLLLAPGSSKSSDVKKNDVSFSNKTATGTLRPGKREIDIPTLDISNEHDRHVIIAAGTEDIRQGHPSTLLLPDGRTMLVTWTYGHGGAVGPLKKSLDGGITWSEMIDVPANWGDHANCPPLYRLRDPEGNERLFIYANRGPEGYAMYYSVSEDDGDNWSPMKPSSLSDGNGILSENSFPRTVMPFTAIVPIEGGNALLGVSNLRRPGTTEITNVVSQSRSTDGGFTWEHWRIILDLGSPYRPCEPEIIRSPDGSQLLMIIRENERYLNSWIMVSNNEGRTWSEPYQSTASVTMDRHQAVYAPDGRIVMVGRDVAEKSPSNNHFVGWVGTYDDLRNGGEGQYRVKLLHTHTTTEYPGLELLPDGTFVATNSVGYRPQENYSLVNTRFTLDELDRRL